MTSDEQRWLYDGNENGWQLPTAAARFWRLPIIRHLRFIWNYNKVERHNNFWRSLGRIPSGYDEWVLYAIWKGWC